jgi:tRNA (adenine37-N6)-methyltransferase
MDNSISMVPIGIVRSTVAKPIDDVWGGLVSRIDLDTSRFAHESLAGLDEFSHVEIVFAFHQVDENEIESAARHPRGRTDWPKVGIFAQRGKRRPNRIGVTVCRLKSVEGTSVSVEGLDAIDGTPVLDIKPYMREFAPREKTSQPAWATELMAGYWNPVGNGGR